MIVFQKFCLQFFCMNYMPMSSVTWPEDRHFSSLIYEDWEMPGLEHKSTFEKRSLTANFHKLYFKLKLSKRIQGLIKHQAL